jgi:hypothetical protein
MSGAGDHLLGAALEALGRIEGIRRVYDAPPLQAAVPYALLAIDLETDWSHKSGAGREVRLAATLHDRGERPVRLRGLVAEGEAALAAMPREIEGWRIVTMQLLRSRLVRDSAGGWAAAIEFRARLLAA